jgi:hypothetical protein
MRLDAQGQPNDQGRYAPDMMWMHAIEFAVAGSAKRAIDMLEAAISQGSLYIPETLPYGAYEFTPEVRKDPRYQAIWRNDARLRDLVKMRLAALEAGQMEGVAPDGRKVTPKPLPLDKTKRPPNPAPNSGQGQMAGKPSAQSVDP